MMTHTLAITKLCTLPVVQPADLYAFAAVYFDQLAKTDKFSSSCQQTAGHENLTDTDLQTQEES